MASALKNLTRVGTDVRQIARLLQAKAPPGHQLAYISEEEAQLLKDRGGSGRITESGIPSYEETPLPAADFVAPPGEASYTPPVSETSYAPLGDISSGGGLRTTAAPVGGGYDFGAYSPTKADTLTPQLTRGGLQGISPDIVAPELTAPGGVSPYDVTTGRAGTELAAKEPEVTKPKAAGMSDATLARLGISGLQAVIGGQQIRSAQRQAQEAAKQTQALAAPYQAQGQQLLAQAQRGELTPANQQIIQAERARAAQGVAQRGGVGVMQAEAQIQAMTNNLLQNQMNFGLQLQTIGDKIAQGAIQAGVQADQYVNTLTSNYAMNIARTLAGGLPGGTTATATPQQ